MPDRHQFVYFDVGDTLIAPRVGDVYAQTLVSAGVNVSPEQIMDIFRALWPVAPGGESPCPWWRAVVVNVLGHTSFRGDASAAEILIRTIRHRFCRPEAWHIFDDVIPALEALRARGLPLGVLSNWDRGLEALLNELGLRDYFQTLVVSGVEGVGKPDRRIYQLARERANVSFGALTYVGDNPALDLVPVQRLGMRAYLIDRQATASNDLPRLRALTELASLL